MKNLYAFSLFFILCSLLFASGIKAQNQYHSIKKGDWADDDTWEQNDSPPTDGNNDLVITINRVMANGVIRHDSVFYTGSLIYDNNAKLTLNVNGTLIINGNIDVHNHLKVNVGENGIFILKGSLNFHNEAGLTLNGNMQVDSINGMNNRKGNGNNDPTGNNQVDGSGHLYVTQGEDAVSGIDLDGFGGIIHYDEEYPLPVELLSFTNQSLPNGVGLSWSTATETNNRGFEIQRMGHHNQLWEVIGWVDGHYNHNGILHYEFIDPNPLAGVNYYRLRQVDYDGKYKFYGPIAISFDPLENTQDFLAYKGASLLHIVLPTHESGLIEVYDLSGGKLHSSKARGRLTLPDPGHPVIVRVINASNHTVSKVVL